MSGHPPKKLAVNVIGYLHDALGVGEAARLYVRALTAGGVPVSTTSVAPDARIGRWRRRSVIRDGHVAPAAGEPEVAPVFNLACVNPDQLALLARSHGEQLLGGRPTIGQFAWETDVLPATWQPGLELVEEIWVNSSFVAENLKPGTRVPVLVVPQAIAPDDPGAGQLTLVRDERFTFLFMLDFFSTLRRKNPLGVVEAFKRAFAPGEGPRLLLKTINARLRRESADRLTAAIADRADIVLHDGYLDSREKAALMARADCYVSLHRSEGFGLTLAESMALGTPVIATAYSGNMDFTTDHNSYLVECSPTLVGAGSDIYPAEGSWAEPDLDDAAEAMRQAYRSPEELRRKGERARRDIERQYAPGVVGALARARLEQLSDKHALSRAPAR